MTLIRKIIIVLVGISLAILVTVLLLNPQSVLTLATNLNFTSVLIRLPLAILIDVIVLAVIVVLVRADRSPQPIHTGLIVKAQGAITDVSVDSARDRILRAVRAVPGVLSAEGAVKAVHGKADVDLDVIVSHASTNLPDKQGEIDRALRQVINKQLGLQMAGKPRVHLRMDDEAIVTPKLESAAPVTTVEPAKTETIPEPEAPVEVESASSGDAMTLHSEETESKPADALSEDQH